MKFDVDDKNRCRLVCVKFHLNRCRFAAAVAKCLEGSLFGTKCISRYCRYSAHVSEKDHRHFTARRYASAVCNNNMLCLSVRLAVSLSQVGVLSKRMDGSSFSDMEVSFDLP